MKFVQPCFTGPCGSSWRRSCLREAIDDQQPRLAFVQLRRPTIEVLALLPEGPVPPPFAHPICRGKLVEHLIVKAAIEGVVAKGFLLSDFTSSGRGAVAALRSVSVQWQRDIPRRSAGL